MVQLRITIVVIAMRSRRKTAVLIFEMTQIFGSKSRGALRTPLNLYYVFSYLTGSRSSGEALKRMPTLLHYLSLQKQT